MLPCEAVCVCVCARGGGGFRLGASQDLSPGPKGSVPWVTMVVIEVFQARS